MKPFKFLTALFFLIARAVVSAMRTCDRSLTGVGVGYGDPSSLDGSPEFEANPLMEYAKQQGAQIEYVADPGSNGTSGTAYLIGSPAYSPDDEAPSGEFYGEVGEGFQDIVDPYGDSESELDGAPMRRQSNKKGKIRTANRGYPIFRWTGMRPLDLPLEMKGKVSRTILNDLVKEFVVRTPADTVDMTQTVTATGFTMAFAPSTARPYLGAYLKWTTDRFTNRDFKRIELNFTLPLANGDVTTLPRPAKFELTKRNGGFELIPYRILQTKVLTPADGFASSTAPVTFTLTGFHTASTPTYDMYGTVPGIGSTWIAGLFKKATR